ncbi:hypothetical protein HHK36_001585 [Tetracentron sinense]|uniref:Peptidase S26 domain-containing protein n=1 Tax=Tetracentron sinense TaxID=13715 RepID=A0A835DR98_TETSI|nr:hypothetical protein HHK36_001585 [Tetracentron sinense]
MIPTFSLTGELILAERISTRFGKVGSGDVVLVRSPENPRKIVTKRVVAMEGHRVTFLVDPKNLDRSQTVVVPKGHVWIQGDNIYASHDSRHFGAVPYGLLHGKVFFKVSYFSSLVSLLWLLGLDVVASGCGINRNSYRLPCLIPVGASMK